MIGRLYQKKGNWISRFPPGQDWRRVVVGQSLVIYFLSGNEYCFSSSSLSSSPLSSLFTLLGQEGFRQLEQDQQAEDDNRLEQHFSVSLKL